MDDFDIEAPSQGNQDKRGASELSLHGSAPAHVESDQKSSKRAKKEPQEISRCFCGDEKAPKNGFCWRHKRALECARASDPLGARRSNMRAEPLHIASG